MKGLHRWLLWVALGIGLKIGAVSADSISVHIDPAEAVAAGAQWRIWDGEGPITAWNPGDGSLPLAPGDYTVQFLPIPGWTAPMNQQVTVTAGTTTPVNGTYVSLTGTLAVTIAPVEAVAAGAQWRIWDGEGPITAWIPGDGSRSLAPGDYTVQFQPIAGWTAPVNQQVTVIAGTTTPITGTYVSLNGTLSVTITPAEAVALGAQWRIWDEEGPITEWIPGDGSRSLAPGDYTIQFSDAIGWNRPAVQEVTVATGSLVERNGLYLPVPLQYDAWLLLFPGIPLEKKGKLEDADGDGLSNVVEMFLGTSPMDVASGVGEMKVSPGAGIAEPLRLSFPRRRNFPLTMAEIQWSLDLVHWKKSGESHEGVVVHLVEQVVDDSSSNLEQVEVTAQTVGGVVRKLYLRLVIQEDSV